MYHIPTSNKKSNKSNKRIPECNIEGMINGVSRSLSRSSTRSSNDSEKDSVFSNYSASRSSSISQPPEALPSYSKSSEILPNYSPSIELFGLVLVKTEFHTPYKINSKRFWEPLLYEINSTQLIFHELELSSTLSNLIVSLFKTLNRIETIGFKDKFESFKILKSLKNLKKYHDSMKDNKLLFEPIKERSKFNEVIKCYNGKVRQRYTLNNLQVGLAPIVTKESEAITNAKHRNILRLRIEISQLCLQFWSFNSMVDCYWYLNVGKDLSGEFTSMPKLKTIPRNLNRLYRFDGFDAIINTIEETTVVIEGFDFYVRNHNDQKFIALCLPELNSFDKWMSATLSNHQQFELSGTDGNIFINYSKLNVKNFNNTGDCRIFVIQQEGLVSLANDSISTLA